MLPFSELKWVYHHTWLYSSLCYFHICYLFPARQPWKGSFSDMILAVRNGMSLWFFKKSVCLTIGTCSWQSQDSNPDLVVPAVMFFPLLNKYKTASVSWGLIQHFAPTEREATAVGLLQVRWRQWRVLTYFLNVEFLPSSCPMDPLSKFMRLPYIWRPKPWIWSSEDWALE